MPNRIRGLSAAISRSAISVTSQVDDPDDEHPGGEQREVTLVGGGEDHAADPRVLEEVLDHHQTADEVADLGGDDGDRREQRVAEDMAAHDGRCRQPLQERRARVVRLERLDHPGPRDARDVAEEDEGEADRGQEQVPDLRQDPGAVRPRRGDRQRVHPDAERDQQEDAGDELGDHREREPDDGDAAVGSATRPQPRDDAPEHAERDAERERDRGELERAPQSRAEQRAHRNLLGERGAEVPVQDDRFRPVHVLLDRRLVGAELLVERVDGGLWSQRPEDDPPDVPG